MQANNDEGFSQPEARRVGAEPLGSSAYTIPSGSIYVALTGNDSNPGTFAAPKRTIIAASEVVKANGTPDQPATVVIRGGVYKEGDYSLGNNYYLRWQAYPGETVWIDGSLVISGSWAQSGSTWTATYAAPPVVLFATDVTAGDPNAHLPDQLWIDGVQQQQIADELAPAVGQFSVNRTANTVTIGTNPNGKQIEYADKTYLLFSGSRVDLLGIGVRRYRCINSPSQRVALYYGGTSMGTVIENCRFEGMGRCALMVTKSDNILRNLTFTDIGQNAILASKADRLIIEQCRLIETNRGRWRQQPEAGAIKVTRIRNLVIRHNYIRDAERGNSIWMDVCCIRPYIYGNYIDGASVYSGVYAGGICYEESDGGYPPDLGIIVGNTVVNTGGGIVVAAGGRLIVGWNTIDTAPTSQAQAILLIQDRDIAVDGQEAPIDEYQRWTVGVSVWSNYIFPQSAGWQFLAYDSQGQIASTGRPRAMARFGYNQLAGGEMLASVVGNNFAPATGNTMLLLGQRNGSRSSFNSPAALLGLNGNTTYRVPAGTFGVNTQGTTVQHAQAYPMPASVAALLGQKPGFQYQGNPLPIPIEII